MEKETTDEIKIARMLEQINPFYGLSSTLQLHKKNASALILSVPNHAVAMRIGMKYGTRILQAARRDWPEIGCVIIKPIDALHAAKPKAPTPIQISMELAA